MQGCKEIAEETTPFCDTDFLQPAAWLTANSDTSSELADGGVLAGNSDGYLRKNESRSQRARHRFSGIRPDGYMRHQIENVSQPFHSGLLAAT